MIWQIPPGSKLLHGTMRPAGDFGSGLWSSDPYSGGQAYNPLKHGYPVPRHQRAPLPWTPPVPPKRPTRPKRTPWLPVWKLAPTFVQAVSGTSSASNTVAAASITPTSGNGLFGFVNCPNGQTVTGVADAGGTNQYTVGTATTNASGARITPFYAVGCPNIAVVITATLSASGALNRICVLEYSGVGSVAQKRSVIDVTGGGSGNTNAPTASVTSQQSASLYLVGVGDQVGGITYTAGGSITRRVSDTTTLGLAAGEQLGSSTSIASLASAWTASGIVQWTESVIVLRPAGTQAGLRLAYSGFSAAASGTSSAYTPQLGEVYFVIVNVVTTGVTSGTPSDTNSNTNSLVQRCANSSGGELSVWLVNGATTSSSQTTSVTLSGGTSNFTIGVLALPGVIPTANLVDTITTNTGSTTAVSCGPSATTAIANETAFLFVGANLDFGATTTNGGSTALYQQSNGGQGPQLWESLVLNATGAQTMTATLGTARQWSAILLTIKTGGVSYVQDIAASGSGGVLPFNSAPGNALIGEFELNDNTKTMTGYVDAQGNTWSKATQGAATSAATSEIWYKTSIVGGKFTTATPTFNSGAPSSVQIVAEYSGLSAFDVAATASGTSSAPAATSPQPNFLLELVFVGFGAAVTGLTSTAVSPMAQFDNTGGTTRRASAGHFLMLSPGAVPSPQTGTFTIASNAWACSCATFKVAGSQTLGRGTCTATSTVLSAAPTQADTISGSTDATATVSSATPSLADALSGSCAATASVLAATATQATALAATVSVLATVLPAAPTMTLVAGASTVTGISGTSATPTVTGFMCQIIDLYKSADDLPIPNAGVRAFWQTPPVTDDLGGILGQIPTRTHTDSTGQFHVALLQGSHCIPNTAVIVLAFQSGEQIGGIVPNIRGPVTLPTLMTTYGWTFINGRSVI